MYKLQLCQEYKRNKGQMAILIALLLSGLLLIIGLGISIVMLQQLKMSGQVGRSVVAFYAADAGSEKCWYQYYNATDEGCGKLDGDGNLIGGSVSGSLDTEITFQADYNGVDTIRSIGSYLDTSRALQVSW